jgi:MFS family permease
VSLGAGQSQPCRRPRPARVLGDANFRLYWAGQTLSGAGNAVSSVALVFAVMALTHAASSLGLVLLASRLPVVVFTLLGGVVGDRYPRRVIMLSADAGRAAVQAVTATLLLTGRPSVVSLGLLQACAGVGSAMFAPAASGLVAHLSPGGQVRQANSVLSMSRAITQVVALAMAGAVVAGLGPGAAFAVDSASFAASTLTLALVRSPALASPPGNRPALFGQLGQGWQAVRERHWLLTYTAHVAALNTLAVSPFFVLGPVVARSYLGGAPAWSAIAISYAAGAFAGSWVTLHWHPARPMLAAFAVSLAFAPLLVLLALHSPLPLLVPAGAAAGAEASVYDTLASTCRQVNVPDHLLSRASSFVNLGGIAGAPVGMGLAGVVADRYGTEAVLWAAGGWVLASAATAMVVPSVRQRLSLAASRPVKDP